MNQTDHHPIAGFVCSLSKIIVRVFSFLKQNRGKCRERGKDTTCTNPTHTHISRPKKCALRSLSLVHITRTVNRREKRNKQNRALSSFFFLFKGENICIYKYIRAMSFAQKRNIFFFELRTHAHLALLDERGHKRKYETEPQTHTITRDSSGQISFFFPIFVYSCLHHLQRKKNIHSRTQVHCYGLTFFFFFIFFPVFLFAEREI